MWELDYKESWAPKNWCFWTVVLEKSLESPLRSNQSILKEISLEYSLEGLMLNLKLQYFGHLMWRTDSLEKDPDAWKDWRQEEKEMTEDEMVGWHHWLDGHEFEWAPGVGDGQRSLACCSPWGRKESDMTVRLNWTHRCSNVSESVTSLTIACQAPLSLGFPRKEYWSGLPCPPPGDLPDPGIEPVPLSSPALVGRFFTTWDSSATWEALWPTRPASNLES